MYDILAFLRSFGIFCDTLLTVETSRGSKYRRGRREPPGLESVRLKAEGLVTRRISASLCAALLSPITAIRRPIAMVLGERTFT